MVERIGQAPVRYPLRFVLAGDSGAWAVPTAEAVFRELVRQVSELDPSPLFFANLGDFAGSGTPQRHRDYLRVVERLAVPNICVIGNHDLDDPAGRDTFERVHGPVNFDFGHGHTRFVVLHAQPGIDGAIDVPGTGTCEGTEGPREEDLAFLGSALAGAVERHRVVLMHMPPYSDGHYEPHPDWGFKRREPEFRALLRRHNVTPGLLRARFGIRPARA